jgi:3-phenylpropionate/trans-cinnamate dioxygenase ferredoxin component
MSDESSEQVEIGDVSDLRDGQMRAFPDLGSHGILVCRVAGTLHAVANNCSHRDTPLSEGRLRGPLITCPLHGAQFDVRDGMHQGPPASVPIACFPITEAKGAAMIKLDRGR